tara:strand:- start:1708 stop:1914 length:207 start_codon:yes stop_codon:yes gene_type:complete
MRTFRVTIRRTLLVDEQATVLVDAETAEAALQSAEAGEWYDHETLALGDMEPTGDELQIEDIELAEDY